jgi:hypothetical protein
MRTSTVSLSCTRCVPSEGIPTMALFLCRRLKLMGTHSRSLTTTLLKRALNQGTLHPPPTPTLTRAQETPRRQQRAVVASFKKSHSGMVLTMTCVAMATLVLATGVGGVTAPYEHLVASYSLAEVSVLLNAA